MRILKKVIVIIVLMFCILFVNAQEIKILGRTIKGSDIKTGADQTEKYLDLLKNKSIAIVANQTSIINKTHIVDSLLNLKVTIKKVFCPEHGFRGDIEAGEIVENVIDSKSGLPIISLYGKKYKPKPDDLKGIDLIIFDIQDVGARFYTYISTLHYVMEAAAENNIDLIVLDRPNPNGYYVDGPVLNKKFTSFVGLHPVPIVYGMTIGEYALMINGEKWLAKKQKCKLKVIDIFNYNHTNYYILPVKPSPNLCNMNAVYLYPSLCLFEGTVVSVGRGTQKPFQLLGHPLLDSTDVSFTPLSIKGMSENPPFKNQLCFGYDLSEFSIAILRAENKLNLFWLIDLYKRLSIETKFFNSFFDKLAGNDMLRMQLIAGKTEDEIRNSWQTDLKKFKEIRKKYLLYTDFE